MQVKMVHEILPRDLYQARFACEDCSYGMLMKGPVKCLSVVDGLVPIGTVNPKLHTEIRRIFLEDLMGVQNGIRMRGVLAARHGKNSISIDGEKFIIISTALREDTKEYLRGRLIRMFNVRNNGLPWGL